MNVYETEIKPIIEQLAVACHDNNIPMFVTVAIENTKEGTTYKSKIIDPDFLETSLTDDKFKDLLNIMNGFQTHYPNNDNLDEFEFE